MRTVSRRQFSALLGLGVAASIGAPALVGQAQPRVVVIGGGAGGATMVRYLAREAGEALDITLIERSARYSSCFFSNLYLAGQRDFGSITHGYDRLAARQGVSIVTSRALAIDRDASAVRLVGGDRLPYDRLVLSPGIDIDFESVPGYTREAADSAPHAWQGGSQTRLLKRKLDALENGQNIVIVAPPNPYRCPPGPYERASAMAHVLKRKGFTDSTITILDTKPSFAKQALFVEGWDRYYPGLIDWLPPDIHGGITGVDAVHGTVETDFDTFKGALLNIIPAQRAGRIAHEAALTDASGYCPIDGASMRSTVDRNIYIIGDASSAGAMPKSAYAANSQARVAALHILSELLGRDNLAATYANTCWSMLAPSDSVKVGAQYKPRDDGSIISFNNFISETAEPRLLREATYDESFAWYAAIIADMFG